MEDKVLRVAATTNPKALAGTICKFLKGDKDNAPQEVVKLTAMGAGAVGQATKACAIARGYVATSGRDLVVRPGFEEAMIGEEEKTVMVMFVTFM